MALSGLEIYKLLPKTNCRECGFPTCLAFAMQLAKKTIELDKCPYVSNEAKDKLAVANLPPIRLLKIGSSGNELKVGNETVLFRHEEKFFNPCAIGIIIQDNLTQEELGEKLKQINKLSFERVGEALKVNAIAIRFTGNKDKFLATVKTVLRNIDLALILICDSPEILKDALSLTKNAKVLIHPFKKDNLPEIVNIAKQFKSAVVVSDSSLESISQITENLSKEGFEDIVIDTGRKELSEKLWDLTQIRRLSLKKKNRSFGYPTICIVESKNNLSAVLEASVYILKYASIVLIELDQPQEILPLLTLRQNIYSDPQKPLQVEPKIYDIGQVNESSPVLVTTNFSLSYFTVLSEVESSRIPSYILSVDTEGMSVLTAWAAEKFTSESVAKALKNSGIENRIKHNKVIIPGYVSVMSGELEDQSGWQVVVGPKEASGIPSFLKNSK